MDSVTVYPSNWGMTSKAEALTFASVVAYVHSINSWDRRITCVIHPEAVGVVESEKFGNIRTEVGPAGYVVTIAEKQKDAEGNVLPFMSHRAERIEL